MVSLLPFSCHYRLYQKKNCTPHSLQIHSRGKTFFFRFFFHDLYGAFELVRNLEPLPILGRRNTFKSEQGWFRESKKYPTLNRNNFRNKKKDRTRTRGIHQRRSFPYFGRNRGTTITVLLRFLSKVKAAKAQDHDCWENSKHHTC